MRGERAKHERVVVIKNLFDPELFDKQVPIKAFLVKQLINYYNYLGPPADRLPKRPQRGVFKMRDRSQGNIVRQTP